MKKIIFKCVQEIVWKYLASMNPEDYKFSLPIFGKFLDFLYVDLGIDE